MPSLSAAFTSPEAKRQHVRRLFATIADRYDLVTRVLSYGMDARWKARLSQAVAPRAGERALDLACGTGDIAYRLAGSGAQVCGLDITPRMLQLARAKQPVVEVPASTETDEAPHPPGATTENIGQYSREEQRRGRGCIVGRMPAVLSPRAARPRRHAAGGRPAT